VLRRDGHNNGLLIVGNDKNSRVTNLCACDQGGQIYVYCEGWPYDDGRLTCRPTC
jgi:hypothetical protein